jgi:hypothetical protein
VVVRRPRVAAARLVVVRHEQEMGDVEARVLRWATGRRGFRLGGRGDRVDC